MYEGLFHTVTLSRPVRLSGRLNPQPFHPERHDALTAPAVSRRRTRQSTGPVNPWLRPTLTSSDAGPEPTAYLEPLGIDTPLPDMPLFLAPDVYVSLPSEETSQAAWLELPDHLRPELDPPAG